MDIAVLNRKRAYAHGPECRGEAVSWQLITYRLPAEPSRHRVAAWRQLRRLGAVPLQQGTWAVPAGEPFDAGLARVTKAIAAAGGEPMVLAVADDETGATRLESQFTAQREAEWGEFIADCGKYEAPLARADAQGQPTRAQ